MCWKLEVVCVCIGVDGIMDEDFGLGRFIELYCVVG